KVIIVKFGILLSFIDLHQILLGASDFAGYVYNMDSEGVDFHMDTFDATDLIIIIAQDKLQLIWHITTKALHLLSKYPNFILTWNQMNLQFFNIEVGQDHAVHNHLFWLMFSATILVLFSCLQAEVGWKHKLFQHLVQSSIPTIQTKQKLCFSCVVGKLVTTRVK
ncbi:hypothetical protein ACJX0J_037958, partial [Zea mays]